MNKFIEILMLIQNLQEEIERWHCICILFSNF